MTVNGEKISLKGAKKDAEPVCRRVVAAATTTLPPNSEAVILVKLAEQEKVWKPGWGLLHSSNAYYYHSSIDDTTKCSPARLMLGWELRLPLDLLLARLPKEGPDIATPHANSLQQTMETVHKFARSNLKLSSDRSKMYYDTKSSDNTYSTGDPVWLYNPKKKKGVSPKLDCGGTAVTTHPNGWNNNRQLKHAHWSQSR